MTGNTRDTTDGSAMRNQVAARRCGEKLAEKILKNQTLVEAIVLEFRTRTARGIVRDCPEIVRSVLACHTGNNPLAESTLTRTISRVLSDTLGDEYQLLKKTHASAIFTKIGCNIPHDRRLAGAKKPRPNNGQSPEYLDKIRRGVVWNEIPTRALLSTLFEDPKAYKNGRADCQYIAQRIEEETGQRYTPTQVSNRIGVLEKKRAANRMRGQED